MKNDPEEASGQARNQVPMPHLARQVQGCET